MLLLDVSDKEFLKYYTYLCCHLLSVQTVVPYIFFSKYENSAEGWPNKNLIREVSVWLMVAPGTLLATRKAGAGRRGGGGNSMLGGN